MSEDFILGCFVGVIGTFCVSAGAALLMVGLTRRRHRPPIRMPPARRPAAKSYGESPEWLCAAAQLGLPVQSYMDVLNNREG